MTVIFQLFNAEDLELLNSQQLGELRKAIGEALGLTTDTTGKTAVNPHALCLEVTDDTQPPAGARPEVIDALKQRFDEVSQQLKSPPKDLSAFQFSTLLRQHFNEKNTEERTKDTMILEWAISCEVNNFKFYQKLLDVRAKAYQRFYELTDGRVSRFKDPDSPYSPFNPNHPLYNLLPPPPVKLTPIQHPTSSAQAATSGDSPTSAGQT
jgi:hypothetical protein